MKDLHVPVNEFDGKVTYGVKRNQSGKVGSVHSLILILDNKIHMLAMCIFVSIFYYCPGNSYGNHVDQLATTVHELSQMEKRAQGMFLTMYFKS